MNFLIVRKLFFEELFLFFTLLVSDFGQLLEVDHLLREELLHLVIWSISFVPKFFQIFTNFVWMVKLLLNFGCRVLQALEFELLNFRFVLFDGFDLEIILDYLDRLWRNRPFWSCGLILWHQIRSDNFDFIRWICLCIGLLGTYRRHYLFRWGYDLLYLGGRHYRFRLIKDIYGLIFHYQFRWSNYLFFLDGKDGPLGFNALPKFRDFIFHDVIVIYSICLWRLLRSEFRFLLHFIFNLVFKF